MQYFYKITFMNRIRFHVKYFVATVSGNVHLIVLCTINVREEIVYIADLHPVHAQPLCVNNAQIVTYRPPQCANMELFKP